ncbi:MAG: glutamate dehydrogenase [Chlamydiae bacterium]|nr:glutamate dehydrogenase [Chlamydiota bacterium]
MSSNMDSREKLQKAIAREGEFFEKTYLWLENHMPPAFFEEVKHEDILLITHSLMGIELQDFFSHIHVKNTSFVLCLDSPEADIKVLQLFQKHAIKNYRTFLSNAAPPLSSAQSKLRINVVGYTNIKPIHEHIQPLISQNQRHQLLEQIQKRNPKVSYQELEGLISQLNNRFLRALHGDRLVIALDMFFRAKDRDNCQYEVRYHKDWAEKKDAPSMQVVFAWRNVPKNNFLFKLSKTVFRHNLCLKRVNATYVDTENQQNILIMSLGLHGINGKEASEEADIEDFLKELVTLKYFEGLERIESTFIDTKLTTGNFGNLIKSITYFIHQVLLQLDPHIYTIAQIEEDLCRHPELVVMLVHLFEKKFDPFLQNLIEYKDLKKQFLTLVDNLDTGNELNDLRRKHILHQSLNLIEYCLKTNFYRNNKTAHSFRMDPKYLDDVPYLRKEKFPELPYAIFFMKGYKYLGYHIRFKDLSRGGLRTVLPQRYEQMLSERNNVFTECYHLAYTQQKKNKDIPEGGAKGVIFVEPNSQLDIEKEILTQELQDIKYAKSDIESITETFVASQKLEHMYQAQRSYIESFVTLLNCEPSGQLRAKHIVDYYKKPEYVYLGPDENMHNSMIDWIASYSKYYHYKPAGAFISSKPGLGINHKEFGVTSLGVNVYVDEILKYLGIDPSYHQFTIKMTGGPDGDVAGNEMENLFKFYPKTARLIATIDVSGTIFDPKGLVLEEIHKLFLEQKPIHFYPAEKLSEGGFLLDSKLKRDKANCAQQFLYQKKSNDKLSKEWLVGSDMNHLLRHNVHQAQADIFVPGGGRPKTLNESNFQDFLNETGEPTAKAIVEGANLYITPSARRSLEKLGVLIIKDSSANKGGVTCSSFEVLCSLCLTEEEFLKEKPTLVTQILEIIQRQARDEARLLLKTHKETGRYLTEISDDISFKINSFTYEFLDFFQSISLSSNLKDPLIQSLLNYCPALLKEKYSNRILNEVPDIHKKAIIACHLASRLVYQRGLDWSPKVVDVLPLILQDAKVIGSSIE